MELEVYTDGGSRGNPGKAACAFVVWNPQTESVVHEESFSLGIATNNEAEYSGFIESVTWITAQTFSHCKISWKLDSLLVVQQLNKVWKIKDDRMRNYAKVAWEKLDVLPFPYTITHVPREKNARADALLNKTLDSIT